MHVVASTGHHHPPAIGCVEARSGDLAAQDEQLLPEQSTLGEEFGAGAEGVARDAHKGAEDVAVGE
jgi:hypothetical protein